VSSLQAGYSVKRFADQPAETFRLERQAAVIADAEERALIERGLIQRWSENRGAFGMTTVVGVGGTKD
jgi:hypothetical protein